MVLIRDGLVGPLGSSFDFLLDVGDRNPGSVQGFRL
jgi:hypothetical protein